eukprot:3564687-Pyramimonas_sp.AAC.1
MPLEFRRWALRCSYPWGHEACEGCAKLGRGRHATSATGALGGVPYGATKRCTGWVKCRQEGGQGGGKLGAL